VLAAISAAAKSAETDHNQQTIRTVRGRRGTIKRNRDMA
jgi:hypothetical protein